MFGINKQKEYANGKIVVLDFRKIKSDTFEPYYSKCDLENNNILFSIEGKIYIDSKDMWCETFRTAFEILIPQTRRTIEEMQKKYQNKHPEIRNISDLQKLNLSDTENFKEALVLVLIPYEIKRRKLERDYYIKPRK